MRMIITTALLFTLGAAQPPPAREAGSLDWLAGRWVSEREGGEWSEESWSPPRGRVMLGTNLSGRGNQATSFEFMRIAREGNDYVFYGSPAGGTPIAFRRTYMFEAPGKGFYQAMFENPDHDFPKVINYRRHGDRLTAGIAADTDGTRAITWEFRRAGD
jgi:hypothetical protein